MAAEDGIPEPRAAERSVRRLPDAAAKTMQIELKREERELRARVAAFRAAERLSRDDLHRRKTD
jgi:F0F1-type ATP synthase membrane subunit b/b'